MSPLPRTGKAPARPGAKSTHPTGTPGAARVFLLTGAESSRKIGEAQALVTAHADAEFVDFDVETMNGAITTADRVLGGVATYPLGTGKRVVLVKDSHQMELEEQKRLAAGLASIPAAGLLILHTGTPITEEGKIRRQSVVVSELVNAVKKVGQILDFAAPKADDLRGWLIQEARALGKTLAPDALAQLAQLPSEDISRIGTELAKAAAHAGDDPVISGADIEATLSRGADDVIFKLCDAVGMRRTQEALGYVSTLFRGGQRPEAVAPRALVLLARQIRLLAQFRYLGERKMAGRGAGPVSPEVMALLPGDGAGGMMTNPRTAWMADKYVGQARNFSGGELATCMERLLQADLALKGVVPGGDDPRMVMQRLVVELC
ncbi:MAG: DNA polymerase III subunit delta [Cytophagales bacterium]|nr:DNA polymerase III subunit delta [Armatimonadota bacterium]